MFIRLSWRLCASVVAVLVLLSCLTSLALAAAPPVYYTEPQEDLRVKVLGGAIVIQRTFASGQWYPNYNWTPLKLTFDTGAPPVLPLGNIGNLANPVKAISRGKANYSKSAAWVFTYQKRDTIQQTTTGFRWTNREGDWIEYDSAGDIQRYGNRNDIKVSFQYEAIASGKRITGVFDHFDRQMLWYDYSGTLLTAIRDYAGRQVQYHYTGTQLTSVTDVNGHTWQYGYTGDVPTTFTDPENRTITRTWANNGELASMRYADGAGRDYAYEYDSAKSLYYVQEKTTEGRVTETWMDPNNEILRKDLNGKTIQTRSIDTAALTRTDTDTQGLKTTRVFDQWDNIIKITYPDGSTVSTTYDPSYSNPLQNIDERGTITKYEYDTKGNLLKKTEGVGLSEQRITVYQLDSYGQLLAATRQGGTIPLPNGTTVNVPDATITYDYDNFGNPITITDAENNNRQYQYDVQGNILRLTDSRNNVWQYNFDRKDHLLSETNPLNQTYTYTYDKVGNRISQTDPRNKTITYQYDLRDQRIKTIDPYTKTFMVEYDPSRKPITATDEEGRLLSRMEYNLDGFIAQASDAKGNTIRFVYEDTNGQRAGLGLPRKIVYPTYENHFRYDVRNRITLDTDVLGPEGFVTGYSYDKKGNRTSTTDPNGKTLFYDYDAFNRLTTLTDRVGITLHFAYDTRGNLIAFQDGKGQLTRFDYDRANRLIREIQPLGQGTTYAYDGEDNLVEALDARGQKVVYTYDAANQLKQTETYASAASALQQTLQYDYDENGNLTGWDDGVYHATLIYDDNNQKLSETIDYGSFTLGYSYTYYANGFAKSLTYPDGLTITYTYDGHTELQGIDIFGEGSISVNEFYWTEPKKITFPGGTTQERGHNGLLNLESLTVKSPGQAVIVNLANQYGKLQEVTQKTVDAITSTYTYDEETRLTAVSGAHAETYTLDAADNRVTHSAVSGDCIYDQHTRLTQKGTTVYEYDDNGNLAQKTDTGHSTSYRYDVFNRLIQVEDGNGNLIARYTYDPFDRRLSKEVNGKITYFLYNDEGLIAEADHSGAMIASYGWRPDRDWQTDPLFLKSGNQVGYFHNDHLGTPIRVTDRSGTILWAAEYSAFGRANITLNTLPHNLRFPGQYADQETGLYYNTRRYYDPETGRYITQDPIGLAGGRNLYGYGFHDPLNISDPTGEIVPWLVGGYVRCFLQCAAISGAGALGAYILSDGCINPWLLAGGVAGECALGCLKPWEWFKRPKGFCSINSFSGEALVYTKEGLKPIQDIKVDEEVLAFSEWKDPGNDPTKDERLSYEKVTDIVSSEREQTLYKIALDNGENIVVTAAHPFHTPNGWRDAQLLKKGDYLDLKKTYLKEQYQIRANETVEEGSHYATIVDVETEIKRQKLYNLEVANAHTFFVGEDGVLVHNQKCKVGRDAQKKKDERKEGHRKKRPSTRDKHTQKRPGAEEKKDLKMEY